MEVSALSAQRPLLTSTAIASPDDILADWNLASAACVIAALLRKSISRQQVCDKAIGLGLTHATSSEEDVLLTAKTFSRLLLAGYRLPAQAVPGTESALRLHLAHGLNVFAIVSGPTLESADACASPDLQTVQAYRMEGDVDPPMLVLRIDALGGSGGFRVPLDRFAIAWRAAGAPMVSAAPSWSELRAVGGTFFGGVQDADGSYHWEIADCDTDAEGRILRYS
jgi:hypothetical protein